MKTTYEQVKSHIILMLQSQGQRGKQIQVLDIAEAVEGIRSVQSSHGIGIVCKCVSGTLAGTAEYPITPALTEQDWKLLFQLEQKFLHEKVLI